MALHLSNLHIKKWQRTESNNKHNINRIYLLTKTKSVYTTASTNNSSLNKAHNMDLNLQTSSNNK